MTDPRDGSPFDELMQASTTDSGDAFTVGFRGYDRGEVDGAIADLRTKLARANAAIDEVRADAESQITAAHEEAAAARTQRDDELSAARESHAEATSRLEAELAAANAQFADAEQRVATLTAELLAHNDGERPAGSPADDPSTREQFEAVLRVAEEQANVLIQNASAQAERLLDAAREEATTLRANAQNDVDRIVAEAEHDAQQVRLRIETEYAAHEARIDREQAHSSEKVAQAEREAEAVRTESEKGAAALRALVTRETTDLRSDAERDVREMNARVLEFEETLTRRQDDAQQEFLVLHNQAVAHAERITSDANEQVASSLEHAQRISARADDYDKLARAQANQIEADARVRAQAELDRARQKAQKIVTTVMDHTTGVLRDAEDRTRQLRWQQQQLSSFMAEVRELIRPDGVPAQPPVPPLPGAITDDDAVPADADAAPDDQTDDES